MAQSCVTFLQVTEAENVGCLLQVRVALNQKEKIAIILPTGQWYAPSAVINDAWYCMVLHGIA